MLLVWWEWNVRRDFAQEPSFEHFDGMAMSHQQARGGAKLKMTLEVQVNTTGGIDGCEVNHLELLDHNVEHQACEEIKQDVYREKNSLT